MRADGLRANSRLEEFLGDSLEQGPEFRGRHVWRVGRGVEGVVGQVEEGGSDPLGEGGVSKNPQKPLFWAVFTTYTY